MGFDERAEEPMRITSIADLPITHGRRVTLKFLPRSAGADQVERFLQEADAVAGLHHTNIVPLYGVGESGDELFMAMQHIDGCGVHKFIAETRERRARGAEPPDHVHRVAEIGEQVADALEYVHKRGVLHRDIKPSNLILDGDGKVWVTGFALPIPDDGSDVPESRDLLGTLAYMAPDRLKGRADERGDIYALGATLYELATLKPAFERDHPHRVLKRIIEMEPARPRRIDRAIPKDLETIILKAMAKDADERYRDAGALREDLHRLRNGLPIRARRSWWLRAGMQ
jgi:serine/threonine protein kinase